MACPETPGKRAASAAATSSASLGKGGGCGGSGGCGGLALAHVRVDDRLDRLDDVAE